MEPESVRGDVVVSELRHRLGCGAGEDMDFAGTGLLCGHGRMRGRHDLEVGQFVPEESPKPPLPLDVQMQIDLVDQEKSPCRQGIGIVVESRRRAIEQIADPRRHVLVAVAQVIQRHGSVDRVEDQRLARLVDVSERNVRKKLGEGRPNQLQKALASHVMQIHCPRCEWAERRVGVEQGSDHAGSDGPLLVPAYAGAAEATRCTIAGEEIASGSVRESVFEWSQRLWRFDREFRRWSRHGGVPSALHAWPPVRSQWCRGCGRSSGPSESSSTGPDRAAPAERRGHTGAGRCSAGWCSCPYRFPRAATSTCGCGCRDPAPTRRWRARSRCGCARGTRFRQPLRELRYLARLVGRGAAGERPRPASEPAQSFVDSYCASIAISAALMVDAQMPVPFSFRCRPSSMKMSSMTVPSACRNGVATSM